MTVTSGIVRNGRDTADCDKLALKFSRGWLAASVRRERNGWLADLMDSHPNKSCNFWDFWFNVRILQTHIYGRSGISGVWTVCSCCKAKTSKTKRQLQEFCILQLWKLGHLSLLGHQLECEREKNIRGSLCAPQQHIHQVIRPPDRA